MKYILLTILFIVVGCGNLERKNSETNIIEKYVWIEVCGKNSKGENWYNYGRIKMDDYEKIETTGKFPEVIRICDFHWFNDGIMLFEDSIKTGEVLVKTYDFERIAVIKDQDIVKLREKYKNAELKRQEKNKIEDKTVIP